LIREFSLCSLQYRKTLNFSASTLPSGYRSAQLTVSRSIDSASFPAVEGNIQFIVIENNERSSVCGNQPEAYVIDTKTDWDNSVAKKIRSDCDGNKTSNEPQPVIDFDNNTALAYFWGEKPASGNSFSIIRIEADPINSLVRVALTFENGPLDALSYLYIIATIPKTSYQKFVFEHSLTKSSD
jgi:hypothetical protein